MDRKEIRFRGSAHKIEFCDLFSQGNHLVHVKKYGASSTLSHLFSQGVVSSALWLQDRDFRRQVNKKLPPTHRLQDTDAIPVASRYKVVFAVMSQSEAPLVLPFFSRVSLRNAAQRLRGYRYKVYKTKIQVQ
jgi:uncharacterized protein (TIGR04141 family)